MARQKDRWPELCKLVEEDDGLPTRDAGTWTEDKLFFWNRYIDITTRAMAGKSQWAGLVYVDLFAGPGVCRIDDTGHRFPGSTLIAARAPKPFTKIIACEKDSALANGLKIRLDQTDAGSRSHVIVGDSNDRIDDVVSLIPDRSLTLAFIDPEGLHAQFNTMEILTKNRRVDLLITFMDRLDIVRNVDMYAKQESSNLDTVLGPNSNWRQKWYDLANQNPQNTSDLFTDIYQEQLAKYLGYIKFGYRPIKKGSVPLYRMVYASKNERGLDFWEKALEKDKAGQKNLPF